MLRELITWVLNTYLGKYLENLNSAQISLALLSGEVELENVPIRKDAFRHFGIPIQVYSGIIGKIKLHVPLRLFSTSPWSISIEQVYCIFGPKDLNVWEEEKEQNAELAIKQSALDELESKWRSENGFIDSFYSNSYNKWLNCGTNVITNVIDNIELKIFDVHLRYEDVTVKDTPIAAGVKIDLLTVQSCDSSWNAGTQKGNHSTSFKVLELNDFYVYWDKLRDYIMCQSFSNSELLREMSSTCDVGDHVFIVYPLSAKAKWKREKCKNMVCSREKPRLSCEILIVEVKISLTNAQHEQIISCFKGLKKISRIRSFWLQRPNCSVIDNPKIWWKYASKCHGYTCRNAIEKLTNIRENIKYIKICRQIAINPNENLSNNNKLFKTNFEILHSLHDLKILKNICLNSVLSGELSLKQKYSMEGKSMLFHWFPNWMGWYGNNVSQLKDQDEPFRSIENDILNALEFSLENNTIQKYDTVFGCFKIIITDGIFILKTQNSADNNHNTSLEMVFENLSTFIEMNPLFTSFTLGITLDSICVINRGEKYDKFPFLICSHMEENIRYDIKPQKFSGNTKSYSTSPEPWFQLLYEVESQTEYKFKINSKSIDIFYHEDSLKWIALNFAKPYIQKEQSAEFFIPAKTSKTFFDVWKSILMGHEEHRKTFHIEIEICTPRIIFLENFQSKNTKMVIFDFGKLQMIKNDARKNFFKDCNTRNSILSESLKNSDEDEMYMTPCSTPPGSERSGLETPNTFVKSAVSEIFIKDQELEFASIFHTKIYDKYTINLSNLQILVCKSEIIWQACLQSTSNFHLIDKFDIFLQVEQRIVHTADPKYPLLTLHGNLKKIFIHANEQKIADFLNVIIPIANESIFMEQRVIANHQKAFEESNEENFSSFITIKFLTEQLVMDIAINNRSIAEIQINGIRGILTKKKAKTEISISIRDLFIIDSAQSFGSEYELLITSHIKENTLAGRTKENPFHQLIKNIALQYADIEQSDAIDILEICINIVHLETKNNFELISIICNNLDVIGNPDVIIELFDFFKRYFYELDVKNIASATSNEINRKMEIHMNVSEVNILFLRRAYCNGCFLTYKAATLVLKELETNVIFDSDISFIGHLGGLEVMDASTENFDHQRVLSVGRTTLKPLQTYDILSNLRNEIYGNHISLEKNNEVNALNFSMHWKRKKNSSLQVRLASILYIHYASFLQNVHLSFKQSTQSLRNYFKPSQRDKNLAEPIKKKSNLNSFEEHKRFAIDLGIDSPVVILPVSKNSSEVVVANLGKISIFDLKRHEELAYQRDKFKSMAFIDGYFVDIMNINMFLLTNMKGNVVYKAKANEMETPKYNAVSILHDTAMSIKYTHIDGSNNNQFEHIHNALHMIEARVTQSLRVSLSQKEYRQLKEVIDFSTKFSRDDSQKNVANKDSNTYENIKCQQRKIINFQFSIPTIQIDLQNRCNENLINILCHGFSISFLNEANNEDLEIILKSISIEDLKCDRTSPLKNMLNSSKTINDYKKAEKVSNSCPDLSNIICQNRSICASSVPCKLNENLELDNHKNIFSSLHLKNNCNLTKKHGNFIIFKNQKKKSTELNQSTRQKISFSSIELECVNICYSIDNWLTFLDFFGLLYGPEDTNQFAKEEQTKICLIFNMDVVVKTLNLKLAHNTENIAMINITNSKFAIVKENLLKEVEGFVGSIIISDLTNFGSLYKKKLITAEPQALNFSFKRFNITENLKKNNEMSAQTILRINMSPVTLVYTKRFIIQLQLFCNEVFHKKKIYLMKRKNSNDGINVAKMDLFCMDIQLYLDSPIIMIPVFHNNCNILIATLKKFCLNKSISTHCKESPLTSKMDVIDNEELTEIMHINLNSINIYTGERVLKSPTRLLSESSLEKNILFDIRRTGNYLFKEDFCINLKVQRNKYVEQSNYCDFRVKGNITNTNIIVNLLQYKLIRGIFSFNFGENIENIYNNFRTNKSSLKDNLSEINEAPKNKKLFVVRNIFSVSISFENMCVSLFENLRNNTKPLTKVHFTESAIKIDKFSNTMMKIDLLSKNIRLFDTRIAGEYENMFKNILQPAKTEKYVDDIIQVKFHVKKEKNYIKNHVILNNIRLFSIIDFFNSLKNFLLEKPTAVTSPIYFDNMLDPTGLNFTCHENIETIYEFILDVNDSEIIIVEDYNRTDTNAIILKCTLTIFYRPVNYNKQLSVNINHLEIFSCILDAENDSALSIIDPCTLNIEFKNNCLKFLIEKQIYIRFSYNDLKFLSRMANLLPKQRKQALSLSDGHDCDLMKIGPLVAMGFDLNDCWYAMQLNNFQLNDAALWLSERAQSKKQRISFNIQSIIVNAKCILLCIIDDCMDADVPLLEVMFSKFFFLCKSDTKNISTRNVEYSFCSNGSLETDISVEYYNRRLSGWEPVVEAWVCTTNWKNLCSSAISKKFDIRIYSNQVLRLNVTTTFTELLKSVFENWKKDYYSCEKLTLNNIENKLANYRRRPRFVPFALKNLTGAHILFKPIYTQPGNSTYSKTNQQDSSQDWFEAKPNHLVGFDFNHKTKLRHMDSHKLNMHQIIIQVDGWSLIGPISIDKVGTFFRHCTNDSHIMQKIKIVFDVSLVGSAQKLVTVRSALTIINKLDSQLILKLKLNNSNDHTLLHIQSNNQISVPIKFLDSSIYFKYKTTNLIYCKNEPDQHDEYYGNETNFSIFEINWRDCTKEYLQQLIRTYDSNGLDIYTLVSILRDKFPSKEYNTLGHSIIFLPPLKIYNMLSCDLIFTINENINGKICVSEIKNIYQLNIFDSFNLSIKLINSNLCGQLRVPSSHLGTVEPKLKLTDTFNRELYLRVSIQSCHGKSMEIYISAPIWILNKTNLPLVYKQEGINNVASEQYQNQENTQVMPLMFSFLDQQSSPALEMRLANSFGALSPWCKSFNLQKKIVFREIHADLSKRSYLIGIHIFRGRGLYSCTTFLTVTCRYQLHNKSGYKLEFAQKCDIEETEILNMDKIILIPDGCHFPFHWLNQGRDPLLCVRVADIDLCNWSKGIPINELQGLFINIRNHWNEMCFLRLEIISKDASNILIFSDARNLPPPIRIDNFSQVQINFMQMNCKPICQTVVRSQSSLSYVLDDPVGSEFLIIEAPGGNTIDIPLNKFEVIKSLTYSNFIYIAFHHTFNLKLEEKNNFNSVHQLVLGVKDKKVILMKKNSGDRSQLWLINSYGQIEHEGSSPPTQKSDVFATRFVLDLEKPANPIEYTSLVIRPPNKQRITTQTWRFEEGRLMCHANMCVQVRNGLKGLQIGDEVVLGRIQTKLNASNLENVPIDQCIVPQTLRPGSGQLEVVTQMNGPICTLQICDVKQKKNEVSLMPDLVWNHDAFYHIETDENFEKNISNDHLIHLLFPKGLGISIITEKPCEELAYISLENINAEIISTQFEKSLSLNIFDFQIDNQILDTSCPVFLHIAKLNSEDCIKNALVLKIKMLAAKNTNAIIIKNFLFEIKPTNVYLEEKLLLKMACFLGYEKKDDTSIKFGLQFKESEKKFILTRSKRYYFENLNIGSTQIRLSVITSSKLPLNLLKIKKLLGFTLIKFEDALIEFDKFSDKHHFETLDVYLRAIKIHYTNQMKWHAAAILGSVDFLGNPLGFAYDLSEGVSGLIFEGSVKSLVKNVTHGISNSTAKLTETLSDSLGRVVLDAHDIETRQRILEQQGNTSGSHLAAGLKGFGFGLLGGITSIVKHTYDGAQGNGVQGLMTGLGKGLVGTITKPIIGILDLASETAIAVRETSRESHRSSPFRKRLPRCVTGAPGGLIPHYSYSQSKGQQYLYLINQRNFNEKLIAYEPNLYNDKDECLRLLVSTEYVRIFSFYDEHPTIMFECHLYEVLSCHPLTTNIEVSSPSNKYRTLYYIEISTNLLKITRPRVRCQNEKVAEAAARYINFAKSVYDEREHSLCDDI